jgi:glycine C-acetyltransferase
MTSERLERILSAELDGMAASGTLKGNETVIAGVVAAEGDRGPRYLIAEGDRPFLRMNSNGYLGMALHPAVFDAESAAAHAFGAGPGAVRFISGTWAPHVELERRLARFHGRAAAMAFSSAYATVMGLLPILVSPESAVISDALNHNCIINAVRLARPRERHIYPHLDMGALESLLTRAEKSCRRAIVATDGVFSMRGDHAPLPAIIALARKFDPAFDEGVLLIVDDSHGVGAFGQTGRGTEEVTGCTVDVLVGTLGKAFGTNGGYVAASEPVIRYLREKAPFYVYSNPITPGEAAAAAKALEIADGPVGRALLDHLRAMTARFARGLAALGFETIAGEHPIVPLMVRDSAKTAALVTRLRAHGILATAINYPVVPKGEEEIRFQISADHTAADIDEALQVLADSRAAL